jgi:hypothetical protein
VASTLNEYGQRSQTLRVANQVCVPSTRLIGGVPQTAPQNPDLLRCYPGTPAAKPAFVTQAAVQLDDGIDDKKNNIQNANGLCVPVTEGTTPPQDADRQLSCHAIAYTVTKPAQAAFPLAPGITVEVSNRFDPGTPQLLKLGKPNRVCLPTYAPVQETP